MLRRTGVRHRLRAGTHSTGSSGPFAAPSRELPRISARCEHEGECVPGQISALDVGFGMPRLFNYLPNYIIIFNYGLAPFFLWSHR
jgi:hypothetical protein